MRDYLTKGGVHVKGLKLWAHVGVLEKERLFGQWFELDFSIWLDLDEASKNDDLSLSVDYSVAICSLQNLSTQINCYTIESFSEEIFKCLENLYGILPMKLLLTKCSAPVPGFNGIVSIERNRNFLIN